MAKAVRFYEAGGPEVLRLEDVSVGEPGDGEVRVRHARRRPELRRHLFPPGLLSGPAAQRHGRRSFRRHRGRRARYVNGYQVGDRVTYTGSPLGAYSTERVMPIGSLFKLPDDIDLETAAAMTMRGLSAAYWLLKTNPWMKAGDTILLHAAAGGVGPDRIAMGQAARPARHRHGLDRSRRPSSRRRTAATRSSSTAVRTCRRGCSELTDGEGVTTVFDTVGKDTFEGSLKSLKRRGVLVGCGTASGPFPPIDALQLAIQGSVYFTRPALADYIADPGRARRTVERLVRPCRQRPNQDRDQPTLRAGRGGAGASRPRSREDDRVVDLRDLMRIEKLTTHIGAETGRRRSRRGGAQRRSVRHDQGGAAGPQGPVPARPADLQGRPCRLRPPLRRPGRSSGRRQRSRSSRPGLHLQGPRFTARPLRKCLALRRDLAREAAAWARSCAASNARRSAATRSGRTWPAPTKICPTTSRKGIDGLYARHSIEASFGARMPIEKRHALKEQFPDAEHPVVRKHPETGREGAVRQQLHDALHQFPHVRERALRPGLRARAGRTCSTT